MGLDVGVVNIEYLERPGEPVYGFLWSMAEYQNEEEWGGSWEGSAFVETTELNMMTRAEVYATEHALSPEGRSELENWIKGLPWRGDVIMLHLGW